MADNAASAVDTEINSVRSQLESIIKEMERGQANIDRRNSVINECETKIQTLNGQLTDFIFELTDSK